MCRYGSPTPETQLLPAVCTEAAITLGAELQNGDVIVGQNCISHPPQDGAGAHAHVDKDHEEPLPSPVRRIFYINKERHQHRGVGEFQEVVPVANPAVLSAIARADAVIFGMGSLYTSIIPALVLEGVGEALAALPAHIPRVLALNGSLDRETMGMTASACVDAVVHALNRRAQRNPECPGLGRLPGAFVTHLLVPEGGGILVDREQLEERGITRVVVVRSVRKAKGTALYDPAALVEALRAICQHE